MILYCTSEIYRWQ